MRANWLIPFKGRNSSREYEQNFLWRHDSIYIMDNHRTALWCWLQHLSANEKYNLFHIDRHYDTLSSRIDEWRNNAPDFAKQTISEYSKYTYGTKAEEVPLVRYDNYLSIFFELYSNYVDQCIFATHSTDRMDPPNFSNYQELAINQLANNLEHCLSEYNKEWICNLDLDFFFCDYNDDRVKMLSDDYIETIFKAIRKKYEDKTIKALTVSLSPEWSGLEKFRKVMSRVL